MNQAIVLNKTEEEVLHRILRTRDGQTLLEWFVSNNDVDLKEAILIRNRIATEADELALLHAILTGNYTVAAEYNAGDIVVRVVDWPFCDWSDSGDDDLPAMGDILEVSKVETDGPALCNDGRKHSLKSLRPATESEKQFFKLGRKRVEFVEGDVMTMDSGGKKAVGLNFYTPEKALHEFRVGKATGFLPVEHQIDFK